MYLVNVEYKNKSVRLNLVIVSGDGPFQMGRDWLQHIRLDWAQLHKVDTELSKLEELLSKHASQFQPGLGKIINNGSAIPLQRFT